MLKLCEEYFACVHHMDLCLGSENYKTVLHLYECLVDIEKLGSQTSLYGVGLSRALQDIWYL